MLAVAELVNSAWTCEIAEKKVDSGQADMRNDSGFQVGLQCALVLVLLRAEVLWFAGSSPF